MQLIFYPVLQVFKLQKHKTCGQCGRSRHSWDCALDGWFYQECLGQKGTCKPMSAKKERVASEELRRRKALFLEEVEGATEELDDSEEERKAGERLEKRAQAQGSSRRLQKVLEEVREQVREEPKASKGRNTAGRPRGGCPKKYCLRDQSLLEDQAALQKALDMGRHEEPDEARSGKKQKKAGM